MSLQPETAQEALEIVRVAKGRILPVGGGTKNAMSRADDCELVSMTKLNRILEYQPSEFTFTAQAGTSLAEISAELSKHGQYLPFDPPLVESGATLGGTLAAGVSGPGAYRYGAVRDFALGIEFVDGAAKELLRAGGKVVKNAAGWDLPKFVSGSYGRFGLLTELTFKVFPCPPVSATVSWPVESVAAATKLIAALARGPWDLDSLEMEPKPPMVVARLRGQAGAVETRTKRLLENHPGGALIEADPFWSQRASFGWSNADDILVKVPVTLGALQKLDDALESIGARRAYGLAGGVAWIGHPDEEALDLLLGKLNLGGAALRDASRILLGRTRSPAVLAALKQTLDPNDKFPELR